VRYTEEGGKLTAVLVDVLKPRPVGALPQPQK
jgi:hypothetical protein